jgi:hypothetical protein
MQKNNKKTNTEITATIEDVVNLKDDFQSISAPKFKEIFENALKYEDTKIVLSENIVKLIQNEQIVKSAITDYINKSIDNNYKIILGRYGFALWTIFVFAISNLDKISHFFGK